MSRTNGLSEDGSIPRAGPMGCQRTGIFPAQDQWAVRGWEYSPRRTNGLSEDGNILLLLIMSYDETDDC
eukprot:8557993-Pyramimonas_sp.AAC.1